MIFTPAFNLSWKSALSTGQRASSTFRPLLTDLKDIGDALWERFTASQELARVVARLS